MACTLLATKLSLPEATARWFWLLWFQPWKTQLLKFICVGSFWTSVSQFQSFPSKSSAVIQALPSSLDTSTRVAIPGTQCTWGSLKHRGGSRSFPKYQHDWYARRWLSFTPYELCWHFIIKHHSAPLPPPLHAKPLTCQGRSMIRSLLAPL